MMKTEREMVVKIANSFMLLLSDSNLSEIDIDAMIEELRPLRMKLRAIDYGSAPGFRKYDTDHNKKHQRPNLILTRPRLVAEGKRRDYYQIRQDKASCWVQNTEYLNKPLAFVKHSKMDLRRKV